MQQGSEAVSFTQALGVVRRRAALIVLCVVVIAGAAFGFSKLEAKKYTATASLVFNNNPLTEQIAGLSATPTSSLSLLARQANELELIRRGDMAAKTATQLGHGLTEQTVSESVSVAGQGESSVVDVSATSTSSALAAEIANTYTRKFVDEQTNSNRAFFKSALAAVRKQLAMLPTQQRYGADGLQLQQRAQTLGLLSELKNSDVQVAAEAQPPASPSSPQTSTNASIGGVLGLFIGIALALMLERFDRRIRVPEDLEAIYDLPLLGTVPRSKALARKGTALPPAEAEAFGLIRAHLRFLNIDHDVHTVAIVSAAAGDGKTTIARRLAETAARSGSQVLLLEMDLRHPTLAGQLDIPAEPGTVDVLIGATPMDEATRSIALETPSRSGSVTGRTLDVLVAGAVLPPNPSELLESQAMEAVLEHARSAYDLVVIDTPALTSVSDAFPLLTKVDGVVIVGRVEHSRRDAAERLRQILSNGGVPVLGVIANDSKGGPGLYSRGSKSSPVVVSTNGASSASSVPADKI